MASTERRRWRYATDLELEEKIRSNTLPRVKSALSNPVNSDCPHNCLCHNVDERRIAELLKQFADGSLRTDAVYVLECRQRTVTEKYSARNFTSKRTEDGPIEPKKKTGYCMSA